MMMGVNHHYFLCLGKAQGSTRVESLDISILPQVGGNRRDPEARLVRLVRDEFAGQRLSLVDDNLHVTREGKTRFPLPNVRHLLVSALSGELHSLLGNLIPFC